jgi:hypothetical protein
MVPLFWRSTSDEIVEDVEVAFSRRRCRDSRFLQVVCEGLGSGEPTSSAELQLGIFAKPGCICVLMGSSASERFQNVLKTGGRYLAGRFTGRIQGFQRLTSADGICDPSLAPFLPALLKLNSMMDLILNLLIADLPAPVSPLNQARYQISPDELTTPATAAPTHLITML